MNTFIKMFYIVLALYWLPAIASMFGVTLSMFHSGFSDIPSWILQITLASLSINVTCYLYFKRKGKSVSVLKYPFILFFVSLILIPLSWGFTKMMSDPFDEQPQPLTNYGGISFHIPLEKYAYTVLSAVPILAAVISIVIVSAYLYEALSNK
ncbi:hypothetical protein IOL86_003282 [Salmonella enterica]|nr:hypothetical protein [Salmonella enterica]EID4161627.1 hypothetical protein [Salmonella enterica]